MTEQRAVHVLKWFSALDWGTLWIGWRRGWVESADVVEFAVDWLEKYPEGENAPLIDLLTEGERLSVHDWNDLLEKQVAASLGSVPSAEEPVGFDWWRLAHLLLLKKRDLDPEAWQDALEELYAELGYPEDMKACSRYYMPEEPDKEPGSPLEAMEQVIHKLAGSLGADLESE